MADLIRAYASEYRQKHIAKLTTVEQRALRDLAVCRTALLGGHRWACDGCGYMRAAYNSCRNRHCPTCGGPRRARWLARLREDLLPVPYFHLVFTLPHELSRLALANRRAIYGLLFQAAWATLKELAANPRHLGARVGAVMVLHTWGQNLEHHPHLHCVVPGGGLSPDESQWIASRQSFFLPVKALSRLFRGKFLAGLKRLHRQGKLQLAEQLAPLTQQHHFEDWLRPLYHKDWVVYVQPPLSPQQGPDRVLKYLARYVAGAAISDSRLIAHRDGQVTFGVKNYRRAGKRQTLTLSGSEFLRRFLLHVLPRGFVRVRYYGLLANQQRSQLLTRCRELLGAHDPTPLQPEASTNNDFNIREKGLLCPSCGLRELLLIDSVAGPPQQHRPLNARSPATAPLDSS